MQTKIKVVISLTSFLFIHNAVGFEDVSANINSHTAIDAKFLYWKLEDSPPIIELVRSGTLAVPNTHLVMGGERIHNPWRVGGKFGLTYWPNVNYGCGIQANYFFLPSKSTEQTVESPGTPGSALLTIPFFNASLGTESFSGLASPGVTPFSGIATLKIDNQMQGAEFNVISPIKRFKSIPYHLIAGLRYWQFEDKLLFTTDSPLLNNTDVFQTEDAFKAKNKFLGLQIGAGTQYHLAKAFLKAKGNVALGAMYSELEIDGNFHTTDFNAIQLIQEFQGGYFALPSNMGKHHRWRLAAIPELNFKLGYDVDDSLCWFIDYSFLYVTDVLWSANQLDRNINPTQSALIGFTGNPALVGAAVPQASLNSHSLWIQGIAIGFIYKL